MLGRIVRSADFERVLGTPSRARSPHFAVHHLAASPTPPRQRPPKLSTGEAELSTTPAPQVHTPVDDVGPQGCWLGAIVPKRNAKRSVTRSLLKRQIRQVFSEGQVSLPPGLWVVRLRAPFDRKLFPSAASDALRAVVRAELTQLVGRVQKRDTRA